MIYLYIGNNSVQLLGLSKTILGQFNPTLFAKTHTTALIENGAPASIDVVASVIKEAFINAQPTSVNDKEVTVVLPQEVFTYGRFNIPADISESAVMPFINDKVRAELKISIDAEQADFIITQQEQESVVLFYALKKDVFLEFQQIFKLLQLKLIKIIPETLAYYKLFEKTLRKDKKEKILYAVYRHEGSFGYLFDSCGLISDARIDFGDDIKPAIKKKIDELNKEDAKVNRLILSGAESKKVRQDLFTKDVGAWTNPLEKIVDNFYQEYLKLIIANTNTIFPVLDYDTCFGAFIFSQENKDFSLLKAQLTPGSRRRAIGAPALNLTFLSEIFNLKTIAIFLISFALSFGIIFGFSNLDISSLQFKIPFQDKIAKRVTPTPAPEPTVTPQPTLAIARKDIKIKVLNGSGIKGKAAEIKEILQDAGYADVITGNSTDYEFEETYEISEIHVKKDKSDAFILLKDDLKDFATLKKSQELDKADTADCVFIIGKDIQ